MVRDIQPDHGPWYSFDGRGKADKNSTTGQGRNWPPRERDYRVDRGYLFAKYSLFKYLPVPLFPSLPLFPPVLIPLPVPLPDEKCYRLLPKLKSFKFFIQGI